MAPRNQRSNLPDIVRPENATRDNAFVSRVVAQLTPGAELDAESQKFMGQRKVAGTVALDLSGVDRTLKTGDPQMLEALDFGAGSDGVPFVHFIDTKGESQYVNVSAPQWQGMLTARSQAREELMFRRQQDSDRDGLSQTFNNLIKMIDLPDTDKRLYETLFEASPESAIKAMQKDHAQRTVNEQKTAMMGGEAALGVDAFKWFQEEVAARGLSVPPTNSHMGWVNLLDSIAGGSKASDPPRIIGGETVQSQAATIAIHGDLTRVNSAKSAYDTAQKSIDQMASPAGGPPIEKRTIDNYSSGIDFMQTMVRPPNLVSAPPMSWNQFRVGLRPDGSMNQVGQTVDDLESIITGLAVLNTKTAGNPRGISFPDVTQFITRGDNGAVTYDGTDAMLVLGPVFDQIDMHSAKHWGHLPLSDAERFQLAPSLIQAIDNAGTSVTKFVPVMVKPEVAKETPAQRRADEARIDTEAANADARRYGAGASDGAGAGQKTLPVGTSNVSVDPNVVASHIPEITSLALEYRGGGSGNFSMHSDVDPEAALKILVEIIDDPAVSEDGKGKAREVFGKILGGISQAQQ